MKNEIFRGIGPAGHQVNWRALKLVSALLFAVGACAFLLGIFTGDPARTWGAYLTNFVFWTGLSAGAFLLSPILVTTNARWGRPVKRIAEATGAFLPVSFLLYWALFFGREHLFWWVRGPHAQKAAWLNAPFFFARDGAGLFVLAAGAVLMTYHSVRSDLELARGEEQHLQRRHRLQSNLAPAFLILYAFVLTLLSFDLIMSLDPEWYSTLFGAYYFMTSFYMGLATVVILSGIAVRKLGMDRFIGQKQFHDLGKLLFAFCVVGADFFYVQFLVIWYGNLPEETRYVITRVMIDPWALLAWLVLLMCYVVPFLVLLFRKVKMSVLPVSLVAGWVLVGMWLERFLLVMPSIRKGPPMPLGPMEILIAVGFLGVFAFCIVSFLERYPLVPASDPLFSEAFGAGAREPGLASGSTPP